MTHRGAEILPVRRCAFWLSSVISGSSSVSAEHAEMASLMPIPENTSTRTFFAHANCPGFVLPLIAQNALTLHW